MLFSSLMPLLVMVREPMILGSVLIIMGHPMITFMGHPMITFNVQDDKLLPTPMVIIMRSQDSSCFLHLPMIDALGLRNVYLRAIFVFHLIIIYCLRSPNRCLLLSCWWSGCLSPRIPRIRTRVHEYSKSKKIGFQC